MSPAASFQHGRVVAALAVLLSEAAGSKDLVVGTDFNLGNAQNFWVPDLGVHRGEPSGVWLATAAIVVGVCSPDDESYEKFGFYFDHGVEEVLLADLTDQRVRWFLRGDREFVSSDQSVF